MTARYDPEDAAGARVKSHKATTPATGSHGQAGRVRGPDMGSASNCATKSSATEPRWQRPGKQTQARAPQADLEAE
jgi:hypothetical protein